MNRRVKQITVEFYDDGPSLQAEGNEADWLFWNSPFLCELRRNDEPCLHMKWPQRLCPNCGAPDVGVTVETPEGVCPCGFKPVDESRYKQVSPGTDPGNSGTDPLTKEQHNA